MGRIVAAKHGGLGPPDARIADLARRQHGVVARTQLLEAGISEAAIEVRIATGRLHPLHLGVYAVGHRAITRYGRWMSAVLACGPTALLSHESAAALWGIGDEPRGVVAVTITDRSGRSRPGLHIHRPRRLEPAERSRTHGIPVTGVARTLVDLAAIWPPPRIAKAFDEADGHERLHLNELAALCDQSNGRRGIGTLRALLARYRAGAAETRSPLERRFLRLCRDAGLPQPALNVPVAGLEVDLYWPEQGVVVEVDSWRHHGSRAAFERDRARDAALVAARLRVIRVTHERMRDAPGRIVSQLSRLLEPPTRDGGPS